MTLQLSLNFAQKTINTWLYNEAHLIDDRSYHIAQCTNKEKEYLLFSTILLVLRHKIRFQNNFVSLDDPMLYQIVFYVTWLCFYFAFLTKNTSLSSNGLADRSVFCLPCRCSATDSQWSENTSKPQSTGLGRKNCKNKKYIFHLLSNFQQTYCLHVAQKVSCKHPCWSKP